MRKNWNPHTLLMGLQNSPPSGERGLAVPQKGKHRLPHDP